MIKGWREVDREEIDIRSYIVRKWGGGGYIRGGYKVFVQSTVKFKIN